MGERLRSVRRQQRLSLQDVETTSDNEFRASVLGAYERGERAISVPRLARLAGFYRVPVDQLLPQDDAANQSLPEGAPNGSEVLETSGEPLIDLRVARPGAFPEAEASQVGWDGSLGWPERRVGDNHVTLDLGAVRETTAPGLEVQLLRRWAGMVQRQRQDFNGRVLSIRAEDLRTISLLLGSDPAAMPARLCQLGLCVRPA
ncbi:MAG: helix-turn-helix domain-containing protein [Acidimicrobiales bacterium]